MKAKILFVDDDASLLASYRRQLRKQYSIETALGGREALELIEQNGPYSVIVSDFRMPFMDGIEFLARVRAIAPDTVRIMLTGSADMQAAIQAVNEGNIFRFLTKPCSVDVLGESLDTGIEQYQQVTREHEYNEKSRHSMALAMEVQQHLIPKTEPAIDGLDIAGRCIYCDETGGDYYDFLDRGNGNNGKICVVVGDVSDHGVSSALLMTSARAFFREHLSAYPRLEGEGLGEVQSRVVVNLDPALANQPHPLPLRRIDHLGPPRRLRDKPLARRVQERPVLPLLKPPLANGVRNVAPLRQRGHFLVFERTVEDPHTLNIAHKLRFPVAVGPDT